MITDKLPKTIQIQRQKQKITASMRHAVWLNCVGKKFVAKCSVRWCRSEISPFNFEAGHNIPESKGGATSIDNLMPICSACNKSMGNRYTIDEYSKLAPKRDSKRVNLFGSMCCSMPRVQDG